MYFNKINHRNSARWIIHLVETTRHETVDTRCLYTRRFDTKGSTRELEGLVSARRPTSKTPTVKSTSHRASVWVRPRFPDLTSSFLLKHVLVSVVVKMSTSNVPPLGLDHQQ